MGLVSNSITGKVEYLIDLEGSGGAKQSTLLSITTAPSGSFEKGSQYYNSNTRLIYTAVEDNTWTDAKTSDPEFGTIYVCDNSGTTEYYIWDGDNLITTDLEAYEKLINKATNFNTLNNTKYPTTKAVADYVVKESIVRNFTDAGITKTTSSDVFSDRTNNTGLAEEILAKQFPTGTTLYGEVRNQGMPTGIGNAEIRVEILETKSNGAQVIEFTLFSVDIEPKEWSHIYFSARTEQQNPWIWVPKAVPTDDYTSNATTTVPSSKALSDGLNSLNILPTIVKNSGSLPSSASGYSIGDKYLQPTAKKIYTPVINGYIANSGTYIANVDVDYNTGIANFTGQQSHSCQRTINSSENWNNSGSATKTYSCKFKISALNTNKPIFRLSSTNSGGPGNDNAEFALKTDNKIYHIRYESYYSTTVISDVAILDTPLEVDTIYVLNIQKTGTDCVAQLTLEDNTVIEEKTFTTTNVSSSYPYSYINYGNGYVGGSYPVTNNLTIYLLDSYGELLVPNSSTLTWDNGTDLVNNTEYVDKTNEILYIYENNELLAINKPNSFAQITGIPTSNSNLASALNNKQNKALSFTNKSASSWVEDNTYADYGYKCDLSCSGVTANMFAQVIFAPTEADSGNYATVCETGNGTVTIYSKVNDTITIPSIVVMGV